MHERSGGEILVANLEAQGATHVYGVPGESFLPVLDALCDVRGRLSFVVCRHEGGAAYMAEAAGKLTGRPGIALVTRGPGATNAAIGVHVAAQDSTPMVLLVGQIDSAFRDREAFQEIDYRRMYGAIAKWVAEIDDAARIPEYVARAFRTAMAGRPGPVVLALPENVLAARAIATDAPRVEAQRTSPSPAEITALRALLARAKRPLAIVGGSGWDAAACAALARFAEANALPVACAFRNQDLLDNRHAHYIGDLGIAPNPKLAARVRAADVLLVIGERLGEMVTQGYTLPRAPVPAQTLIHVHPGPEELGRVYQPALAILASPGALFDALGAAPPLDPAAWNGSLEAARNELREWRSPRPVPGEVDLWRIVLWLDERLPEDAIVASGAGNYTTWIHRLFRYRRFRSQLAPYAGSMGYAVPAAIAAKLSHPDRTVVSWNGDGCFLMNGQELATAVRERLAIVFVVIDNAMYGTIRMHQERDYPGRVSGSDLLNPDFAALARAYGAHGEAVARTDEFAPAFERALAFGGPALVHVKLDAQAITMNASLDAIRAAARAKPR